MGTVIELPVGVDAVARRARLGDAVRRARGSRSQAEFGALVGVGQPAVSGWETGRVRLTFDHAARIEGALGLEPGWIGIAAGYVDPDIDPYVVLLNASIERP